MRIVLQRVTSASVKVNGEVVGEIEKLPVAAAGGSKSPIADTYGTTALVFPEQRALVIPSAALNQRHEATTFLGQRQDCVPLVSLGIGGLCEL